MSNDTQATGQDAPEVTTAPDTASPQPSEASGQQAEQSVETKTPEATQDNAQAQEAQAPETKAEDTVEEKLYAGKYKSVDELEKAYQSAESKLGSTTSEKAELAKILNEAFTAPEETAQQATTEDTDSYAEDTEHNPVNQELASIKTRLAISEFLASHQGADAQALAEIINSDPNVANITSPEAKLEYAHLKSQNMSHEQAVAEAQKQGATQAQVKAAEKQVAQVEGARKAEPVDNKAELIQRVKAGDPKARAQAISDLPAVREMKRQAGLSE